jgi:hypothetical protein
MQDVERSRLFRGSLAAPLDPIPLALLLGKIEGAAIQRNLSSMVMLVMLQITFIGVIATQLA